MVISETSDHIQINIKMPKPSQKLPASSKAQNKNLKGHGFSLHSQNQNRDKICILVNQRPLIISKSRSRCQNPVRNHQPPPKPKIRTQSTWMFLHLQIHGRDLKFGTWVYQRPVNISKSRSRCQNRVRNLQCPPKPQMRT